MKKSILFSLFFFGMTLPIFAQLSPAITSWVINTTGLTGYNCPSCTTPVYGSIPANVQSVSYTSTDAYIKSQGIGIARVS